jgi:DNA-binding transcriptional MocR family regulator
VTQDFRLYKDDEVPLYIQAADALRARIVDGGFRPGDRLPSVRKLSDELAVNPATVVAAYRILGQEGFLEPRAGSGVFVATGAPLTAADAGKAILDGQAPLTDSPLADFSSNAPPLDMFPLEDVKRFLVEAIDADGGRAFEYQDTAGYAPLKLAMADRLARAWSGMQGGVVPVDPLDVHIVSGAQQGIDLAARVLLRKGDVAVVESPGYRGARDAFVAAGARVEPLPIFDDGLDIHALERLASSRPLRLVHVNPDFQNPTGIEYSAENRAALVSLALRYGFYILEDDLFSDLGWDGSVHPSVRSYDRSGQVIYVKSFSKALLPGLRIACLEAPAALRDRFESAKRSIDISSSGLMQRVLQRFLTSGRFDGHVDNARQRYRAAYHAFSTILEPWRGTGLDWKSPCGGINLWIRVPPAVTSRIFAARCLYYGCLVSPEPVFRCDQNPPAGSDRHVRVSFGSVAPGMLNLGAGLIGRAASELS